MGYYLVFNGKENNTKSISYPMGAIIRDVLPKDMEEDEYGWMLKKKHVAALSKFTMFLLEDDNNLRNYIDDYHKDDYGFDDSFEEVKETIEWIHNCFVETLIEMVLDKQKYILAKWV